MDLTFAEWSLLHSFQSFEDNIIIAEPGTPDAEIINKLVAMGLCNCVSGNEHIVAWTTRRGDDAVATSPYNASIH